MNSDQLFYQKYLKYKNKYLELKELLGGRDPAYYNVLQIRIDFKESPLYIDIRKIISKFIEDLIVKYALEKMNMTAHDDQAQGLQFLEKIFKNSSILTQDSAILKHVKTIVDSMIWESTSYKRDSDYAPTMNLIKVNKDSDPYGDNIHISLAPTGTRNRDIDFHLTEYIKIRDGDKGRHFNTKADVYNFFCNTKTAELRDGLVDKYLVLAVYAFNFFVSDESHDLLETVLLSPSQEVKDYIKMLLTKYIPRFFDSMLDNNLKPIYYEGDIYDNVKEVFKQGTKEEAISCISKVQFKVALERKKAEEAAKQERIEATAKADEDARVDAEAKCEKAKVDACEVNKAKAKEDAKNAAELLRANNINGIRETIISTYGNYIVNTPKQGINSTINEEQIENIRKLLESLEKILNGTPTSSNIKQKHQSTIDKEKKAEIVIVNRLVTSIGFAIVNKVINTAGKSRYKQLITIPKGYTNW